MPSEKELRDAPSNIENYMNFLSYNKELISNKNLDLELSKSEKNLKDFLDLEIEKMV